MTFLVYSCQVLVFYTLSRCASSFAIGDETLQRDSNALSVGYDNRTGTILLFGGWQTEQQFISFNNDQFIDEFTAARKLSKKQAETLADGRIFTGRQAKKQGLIDDVGSFDDALKLAQKLAKLKGEPHIINKAKPSLQDMIEMIKINAFSDLSQNMFNSARFGDIKVH